jgi:hypothetical protein
MEAVMQLFGFRPKDPAPQNAEENPFEQTTGEPEYEPEPHHDESTENGDVRRASRTNALESTPNYYDWRDIYPELSELRDRYQDILMEAKNVPQW